MEKDKLQISTRISDDKKIIDIIVPPECVMRDKKGKVFVDPDFIQMVHESMKDSGIGKYEMAFTELKETLENWKKKKYSV